MNEGRVAERVILVIGRSGAFLRLGWSVLQVSTIHRCILESVAPLSRNTDPPSLPGANARTQACTLLSYAAFRPIAIHCKYLIPTRTPSPFAHLGQIQRYEQLCPSGMTTTHVGDHLEKTLCLRLPLAPRNSGRTI